MIIRINLLSDMQARSDSIFAIPQLNMLYRSDFNALGNENSFHEMIYPMS